MGGSNKKPVPMEPKKTMQEVLIEMKMKQRQFENSAKKAEKQKDVEFKKAQAAIQKNNEEGAKIYLQNMVGKDREMKSMQRMAHKLEALQVQIQLTTSNTAMVDHINKITPLLIEQAGQISSEQMFSDMDRFEKSMDDMLVAGKVMDQVMNNHNGQDIQQNNAVDGMLNQLKLENLAGIENHAQEQGHFRDIKYNQPQQNAAAYDARK